MSRSAGGTVPDDLVALGAKNIITGVVQTFAGNFYDPQTSFADAWRKLAQYDHLSMRGYLTTVRGYDEATVDWLETNTSGTGLFDCAFVQTIMDFLDFGMAAPMVETGPTNHTLKRDYDAEKEPWEKYDWWAVDGGVDHIAERMRDSIRGQVHTQHRVTKIETTENRTVLVTFDIPGQSHLLPFVHPLASNDRL